jgi:hypothetical protein
VKKPKRTVKGFQPDLSTVPEDSSIQEDASILNVTKTPPTGKSKGTRTRKTSGATTSTGETSLEESPIKRSTRSSSRTKVVGPKIDSRRESASSISPTKSEISTSYDGNEGNDDDSNIGSKPSRRPSKKSKRTVL